MILRTAGKSTANGNLSADADMNVKGYFITGTDTGVGKTLVTAALVALFKKRGWDAGVMKPFETGIDPNSNRLSDAEFLLATAGLDDPLSDVSPARFQTPASPYQASLIERREIDVQAVIRKFHLLQNRRQRLLVEGIGGILVPIRRDYLVIDLIKDLGLPAIVVSRLALGTINHTLLTVRAAQEKGIAVRGVIFNRQGRRDVSELDEVQSEIIGELGGVEILGEFPSIADPAPESYTPDLLEEIARRIQFDRLLGG